jgi:hypothetical protein
VVLDVGSILAVGEEDRVTTRIGRVAAAALASAQERSPRPGIVSRS